MTSYATKRKVLNVREVSKALCLAPLTIRKEIRKGKLKAVLINGRYFIRIEEVDDFLDRNSLQCVEV